MKVQTLKATAPRAKKIFQVTGLFLGTIAITSLTTSCNQRMPNASMPRDAATPMGQMDKGKTPMGQIDHSQMDHSQMPMGMNHSTMDLGKADADYDLRFIDGMMPHHEGAVTMAKAVLQNSQRPELKKLAETVIRAQAAEIATMQQWRKTWYPKAAATPMAWQGKMQQMMPMSADQIKSMRMDMDLGKADADFDRRFLEAMIPHHEGAIVMAQDALTKSKRPEVQKLAKEIITSQQAEIDQMNQWRQAWYGK